MLKWWVQTSGIRSDYRFLGTNGEPNRWWAAYLRYSAPEDPMFIVETNSSMPNTSTWRLYVTAMPTNRRDGASPPREIRISVLLEGSSEDSIILAQILSRYFDDSLANALQEAMPEPMVENWLSGQQPKKEELDIVTQALTNFDDSLTNALQEAMPEPMIEDWLPDPQQVKEELDCFGRATDKKSQQLLIQRAKSAAKNGETGVFCWLNLLAEPKNLRALSIPNVKDAHRIVVLLDGSGPVNRPDEGLPINPPVGCQSNARTIGQTNNKNKCNSRNILNRTTLPAVILAVTLLILVALILTLQSR
jgi:hypothetical protein